jgi:aryl-phospho-beta-D-glucosidase BglC (GH1 family)
MLIFIMKKFLDKAKLSLKDQSSLPGQQPPARQQSNSPIPPQNGPSRIAPPTALDVIRYRYHHGVNLGSIFVLEQWLHPSMFPASSPGGAELDAVTHSLQTLGLEATRAKWEQHWASAVSAADLSWLVNEAHCTSMRLPVGYFTLGKQFCVGTPFETVSEVYVNAWGAVRKLVACARSYGIGVLLDLHALPGGANGDAHSGTSSGRAEFWGHGFNMRYASQCLEFMAKEIKEMDGVVGLQVVNEAVWDAKGLYGWYEEVLIQIQNIDRNLPVYVSDAWDLDRALKWSNGRRGGNPVVVDTHRYYTFSDKDRSQAPAEIITRLPGELLELNGKDGSISDRGEAQVVIGEYSCVLDGQTWRSVQPESKDGYVKQFGHAQSKKWQERSGGAYFWTYKMDWMDGGEWGFVEQTKKGNLLAPPSLLIPMQEVRHKTKQALQRRDELGSRARKSHEEYWKNTSPLGHFEHERYSDGWNVGFSDAFSFFVMRADGGLGEKAGKGGDRIGCLDIWVKKRLLESDQKGPFVWEWEQGLRAGIQAFNGVVGI